MRAPIWSTLTLTPTERYRADTYANALALGAAIPIDRAGPNGIGWAVQITAPAGSVWAHHGERVLASEWHTDRAREGWAALARATSRGLKPAR